MAKMGRPTLKPKTTTINFRLTEEDKVFLLDYAKKNSVTLTELFVDFVDMLKKK
ncbi:MAG: hypothetical protein J6K71_02390 [Clostridia bacterium]|nr:hypothetical protein [Clostridia bacterium]